MSFRILVIMVSLLLISTAKANDLSRLKTLKITSKISEQTIAFDISLPVSYQEQADKHYPVFITTAGKSRIAIVHEQVKWLSHVDFAPMPEVIFVTLPAIKFNDEGNKYQNASGARDALTAKVLTEEVLPYIDQHYRTTPYRVIEGFSSFGNFPLYMLRHHSADINAFFIFSPSMELDNSGLVQALTENWQLASNRSHFVYLSLGTFLGNKKFYQAIKESLLSKQQSNQLVFEFADFSQDNYLSGPNLGLIDASQSLFADLQPDYKQFHKTGENGLKRYFQRLSDKYCQQIDLTSKLVDLSFSYAAASMFPQAIELMESVINQNNKVILLRIRLAQIQVKANQVTEAKLTLKNALVQAKSVQDHEAISYIESMIASLSD